MASYSTITAVVFAVCFVVFVIFFGRLPALRKTPIATLHRVIWVHIPNAVLALDQRLTSGRVSTSLSQFFRHLWHDRHPTILIFFLALLVVGEALFLPPAWPALSVTHKTAGTVAIILPYVMLYLAAHGDPGYVGVDNLQRHLELYPYDFSIFHPGQECRTCRVLKPARSKHCSVCKRCVARSDHHCIFINKCVGYRNYRWFILLLFCTASLTTYGGLLGVALLSDKLEARFPDWSLWPPATMQWNRYFFVWGWGLQTDVGIGSTTLLAVLISPMIWAFFAYSAYLLYCGMTTNESLKWSDMNDEMRYGSVYRRLMTVSRPKDLRFEAAVSRWPRESKQILVPTETGQPPVHNPNIPGVGHWERVFGLKGVDNLYDLGLTNNLIDVFVPGYRFGSRRDDLGRAGKSGSRRLL